MKTSLVVLVSTVAAAAATPTPPDIDAIEIVGKDASSQQLLRAGGNRRKLSNNKSKQNSNSKKDEPSQPKYEPSHEPNNESKPNNYEPKPDNEPDNEPSNEPNKMFELDAEYGNSDGSPADLLRAKKIAAVNKAKDMADEAKIAAEEAADIADEAKKAADKAAKWMMRTLAPNTAAPKASAPNASPVMAPAVVLSGDATGGFTINAAPEAADTADETQSLSPCPLPYDSSKTDYAAWDTVSINDSVYMCRPPPYEPYCNIISLDRNWDAGEKDLWDNAWDFMQNCAVADPALDTYAAEVVTVTPQPSPRPTPAPTPIPVEADQQGLPNCPPAYDWTKTTYIAGETVEIKEHIFQCNLGDGYELYCNQAGWDDALLEQNDNARQMWNDAWVGLGPCEPISIEEVMEDRLG